MYTKILDLVRRETSGARALVQVSEIVRHHRIQASPGLRAAAAYCAGQLDKAGLTGQLRGYPYDGTATYWTSRSFEEWDAGLATLDLVEPAGEARRLADYDEQKLSVIQRSGPTPEGGITAELVAVDDADRDSSYQDLDVRGKLVLVRGDIEAIRQQAVVKRGALGLVSDAMTELPPVRSRLDLPDARQYTSFWWADSGDDKCFGFVLTPRQGEWLRALLRREGAAGRPVRLRAEVQARFYPGAIDNAEALLPGTGEGEVVVVAHLCHPQASANDNASGCAAAMEAGRVLAKLISGGQLPRPQRSVRFLLVPEFAGTYAFLARNEGLIPGMVAAINLDMVGEDQDLCRSSFLVEKPPRATGSFAGDLAELILGSLSEEVGNLASTSKYALFRHSVTPFSGGSDHYIFSDPTVGVPCPMIIQWPDKFYHTSADTLDKVDPASLARAAMLTATYAYFLASAGPREAAWLAGEMAGLFAGEAASAGRQLLRDGAGADLIRRKLGFLHRRKEADLESLRRLLPPGGGWPEAEAAIIAAKARLEADAGFTLAHCLGTAAPALGDEAGRAPATAGPEQSPADARRPRRTFRGPLGRREMFMGMDPAARRAWMEDLSAYLKGLGKETGAAFGAVSTALFWTDGRRTMADINELVQLESGWCDPGMLARVFDLLAARGWIAWE